MKKGKTKKLINRAKTFIGREIEVAILDDKYKVKRKARARLVEWTVISVAEEEEAPNIQIPAKLEDTTDNTVYTPSLKSVVEEFERIDREKSS